MPTSAVAGRKILLVGELNPYGSNPEYALYPYPAHASGNRLRKILGLSLAAYLNEHDRVNLCGGTWSSRAARLKAREILETRAPGSGVVLLGTKVAHAFDVAYPGGVVHVTPRGLRLLVLPHPSGRNLVWNTPEMATDARARYTALRAAVDGRSE